HRPRPPMAMASVWRARKPARNLKRRDKAAPGHGPLLLVGLAVAAAGPALLAAAASFAILAVAAATARGRPGEAGPADVGEPDRARDSRRSPAAGPGAQAVAGELISAVGLEPAFAGDAEASGTVDALVPLWFVLVRHNGGNRRVALRIVR